MKIKPEKQVLRRLALRSLKTEKGRTLAAVFAVMITAALFTAIIFLFSSVQKTQKYTDQLQSGDRADAQVKLLSKEEAEKVRHLPVVEEIGIVQDVAYVSNMKKHHSAVLIFADEAAQEMTFTQVTDGRAPEKSNEIAASQQALHALNWDGILGSSVEIAYKDAGGVERIFSMSVTGTWEQINVYDFILVSKAFAEREAKNTDLGSRDSYTAYLMMKENKSSQEEARVRLSEELSSISLDTEDFSDPAFAKITLSDVNIAQEDGAGEQKRTLLAAVIGVLFFLCGYLLIYNVFDISIQKDIRYYGLLKTVGAEKRQILQIIFRQAAVFGGVGIAVGNVIGMLVSNALLPAVLKGFSVGSAYQKNIVQHAEIIPVVLLADIWALCTLSVSILRPALQAGRVTAAEALRFTDRKTKRKKIVQQKEGLSRSWPVTQLAYRQFTQNMRRTVFVLVSIVLSIVFVDAGFMMSDSVDVDKYVKTKMKTDYILAGADSFRLGDGFTRREDALDRRFADQVQSMPGVSQTGFLYKNTLDDQEVTFDYGVSRDSFESIEAVGEDLPDIGFYYDGPQSPWTINVGKDGRPLCNVYGVQGEVVETFFIDHVWKNMDRRTMWELYQSGNYVIEGQAADYEDSERPSRIYEKLGKKYWCRPGQKIKVYKDGKFYKSYTVLAQMPVVNAEMETTEICGLAEVGNDGPLLYFPFGEFRKIYENPALMNMTFNVEEAYQSEMNAFLKQYTENVDEGMGFSTSKEAAADLLAEKLAYRIIGTIAGAVLGIAGIMNFVNIIASSILSRQKELSVMQSIGMTCRQMRAMVMWEGLYYAIAAGLTGFPVCILAGRYLIRPVLESVWYNTYQPTLVPAALLAAIFLGCSVLIPVWALRIWKKGCYYSDSTTQKSVT